MSATRIAIAVVEHAGRFLVGQRSTSSTLAGKWEFPGGKVEAGETPPAAAARECREETGLRVAVGEPYPSVKHTYDHGQVELFFFACRPLDPAHLPRAPFRWVERSELAALDFPAANAQLVAMLAGAAA